MSDAIALEKHTAQKPDTQGAPTVMFSDHRAPACRKKIRRWEVSLRDRDPESVASLCIVDFVGFFAKRCFAECEVWRKKLQAHRGKHNDDLNAKYRALADYRVAKSKEIAPHVFFV